MSILSLPANPDRAWLWSFWIAVSLSAAVATAAAAWIAALPFWVWVGPIALVVVALPGLAFQRVNRRLYEIWSRLGRGYSRVATAVLLAIAYHAVMLSARGRRLQLERPRRSLWTPRTEETDDYRREGTSGTAGRGGFRKVTAWAGESGRPWALGLIPYLALLAAFEGRKPDDEPGSIYTLY